jgi:hypothetical protein
MKKLAASALLLFAIGCEYNTTGPTVNVTSTNTNTNTNNTDIHDLTNFVPVANPAAPLPNPTTGGTETPLGIPSGSQAIAQAFATANPLLVTKSCVALYGEAGWQFMDGLIKTLRASDARWGYVIKSSTGTISMDVIAYRATSDNTGAWGVDVIVDHCGNSSFAWNVLGLDANLQWSGTRF